MSKAGMLQTPLVPPLTQGQGRALFEAYRDLLGAYDRGEIAESVLADLVERNNVERKAAIIREKMR